MSAFVPGSVIVGRAGYSAGYQQLPLTGPADYSANNSDAHLSIATLIFGDDSLRYRRSSVFVYEKPTSPEDALHGAICAKTGFWAPAHCIVRIGGVPYIQRYAPREESRKNADWLE